MAWALLHGWKLPESLLGSRRCQEPLDTKLCHPCAWAKAAGPILRLGMEKQPVAAWHGLTPCRLSLCLLAPGPVHPHPAHRCWSIPDQLWLRTNSAMLAPSK